MDIPPTFSFYNAYTAFSIAPVAKKKNKRAADTNPAGRHRTPPLFSQYWIVAISIRAISLCYKYNRNRSPLQEIKKWKQKSCIYNGIFGEIPPFSAPLPVIYSPALHGSRNRCLSGPLASGNALTSFSIIFAGLAVDSSRTGSPYKLPCPDTEFSANRQMLYTAPFTGAPH